MKTKNIFFHECNIGDEITYNAIYPNTIKVLDKKHLSGQCKLTINGIGFAAYGSAKIIIK